MYKLSLLASLVISAANAEDYQSQVHFGEDEHFDYNKYHSELESTTQNLFLGFGKNKQKDAVTPVVKRFANGTIDWGTPGNRPLEKPVEYYQTFEQIVTGSGFMYEEYQVTTADGYILDVYRIKSKDTEAGAPVVFF